MRTGRRWLVLLLVVGLLAAEQADDDTNGGPWSHSARLSLQGGIATAGRADTSRDTTISGSNDSYAWRGGFLGTLTYAEDRHEVGQKLDLAFGRKRVEGESWSETVDRVLYDAAYVFRPGGVHRPYGAWAAESNFTGPEPDRDPFDTVLVKLSSGYGQERKDLLPTGHVLSWRAGVRAQRRWGRVSGEARDWAFGPEARLRIERSEHEQLTYHVQYDVFTEFEDLAHITHLGQAGLDIRLNSRITLTVTGRLYYEGRPSWADDDDDGYDTWSWSQESLVGVVISF